MPLAPVLYSFEITWYLVVKPTLAAMASGDRRSRFVLRFVVSDIAMDLSNTKDCNIGLF